MSQDKEINIITKKLVDLTKILRERRPSKGSEFWKVPKPSGIFKPEYNLEDQQQLYQDIIQRILKLNQIMLSEYEVNKKVFYEFIIPQIHWDREPLVGQELIEYVTKIVSYLAEFKNWEELDVAIAYLELDGEPVTIGEVTFLSLSKDQVNEWKRDGYCPDSIDDVKVVAHLKSPGDEQKALLYAKIKVNQVLDVIRAFCLPFGLYHDRWPIGFPGDVDASHRNPLRKSNRRITTFIGNPRGYANLHQMVLDKYDMNIWTLIDLSPKNSHTMT